MHKNSLKLMNQFRDKYLLNMKGCTLLDVGSRASHNEGGRGWQYTYRRVFLPDYIYTGMDLEPGRNVNIVGYEGLSIYDVVVSGQVIEHVKRPWDWLKNLTQYYKKYICIIGPNTIREHKCPLDTYRYFPDGMRDLFEYAGIKEIEIWMDGKDTIGIGGK